MWYYALDNRPTGPLDAAGIAALIGGGTIRGHTLVWREGMSGWQPAAQTELAASLPPGPPPVAPGTLGVPPYRATDLDTLFLWYAILGGAGVLLSPVFVGIPALIAAIVLGCILLYRCWDLIQDGGSARTTPGLAVGLGFIPLWHLYWIFVSHLGLATDMRTYLARRGIACEAPSEALALWTCILTVVACPIDVTMSFVPFGSFFTLPLSIAHFVLALLLMHGFVRCAKAIVSARRREAGLPID